MKNKCIVRTTFFYREYIVENKSSINLCIYIRNVHYLDNTYIRSVLCCT